MNLELSNFLNTNESKVWKPSFPAPNNLWRSDWPWAPIILHIDQEKVKKDLESLKYFFVPHRDKDKVNSYGHEGWESVTLHGISYDKTENYDRYGYASEQEANYHWTEVYDNAPYIIKLIKTLPYSSFGRVRIMKLRAGGYIMPHTDGAGRIFGPMNFALNNPKGCRFVYKDYGTVPFETGRGFFLDLGIEHCVYNESNEDRYHLIVHGQTKPSVLNLINESLLLL